MPVLLVLALAVLLLQAVPAGAVFHHRRPPGSARLRSNTNTELVMTGTGPGQSVTGFIADPSNPFDPVVDGYPTTNPATGFRPKDEGFAGIIHARPSGGGAELSLYCIDILTDTFPGIGYGLGSWDASNVPNVGYVARLLSEFYPNTDEPSHLTDLNPKAAAVQAAIWFFTDRYVLNTSSPLHDTVAAIVARIISEGPLVKPPPPSLTLTPADASGPAGRAVGPFEVTTNARDATVTAAGGSLFADRSGTEPIPDGATVPTGQKIWVRSDGPSTAVLHATSQATVPSGNVYLYDGNYPGVNDAQRLILAETATLTTTVRATAEFLAPGSLVVTKRIGGPAAGSQGRVVIHVACDDGVVRRPFVIRAGAPAGAKSRTYRDIPAGTTCTVTETSDGSVVGTDVVVTGDGQQVTIPSGRRQKVKITDRYHGVGSLLVRKTIDGPAAGQQGEIRIHSECNGTALTPDLVIGAGAPAGDQTRQYDHIPAPATCTVTETADGHTSQVSVVVEGSGQTVSVPAGDVAEANIGDTYGLVPRPAGGHEDDRRPAGRTPGDGRDPAGLQREQPAGLRHPGGCARGRPVAHLLQRAGAGQLCRHRDRGRSHQCRLRSRQRQPADHHDRARRRRGGPHHRHLWPHRRLPARHQDHRGSAGRPPGTGEGAGGLQRRPPVTGLRDRFQDPGGQRVAQLRRYPGRLGVHRHRGRRRSHRHGRGDRVGQWAADDRPGGQGRTGELGQRVPGHAGLPESDQDDHRRSSPSPWSDRHPGRLWQSAQRFRLPHRRPHRNRFCVAAVRCAPCRIPLHRHRDRGRTRPTTWAWSRPEGARR